MGGQRFPIYCITCGYPLRGLESSRCPECGREFNPRDMGTVRTEPLTRGDRFVRQFPFLGPILTVGGVLGATLIRLGLPEPWESWVGFGAMTGLVVGLALCMTSVLAGRG